MELGISSYSYTWSLGIPAYKYKPVMDVFDLVRLTRQHELSLLQIADNVPLHKMNTGDLHRLKELCCELNVKIEVGSKGLTEENLEAYLQIADLFEARILRYVFDDASVGYKPSLENISAIIKNAVQELARRNIILAIENYDRFRADEFVSLLEAVGSPFVGVCLDCANSLGAGEGIYETVSRLAPFTVNLHLKDISIQRKLHKMGFDINGVPFGKGIIPIQWVIKKMPERCKTAILELWMPPEEDLEQTFDKEHLWVTQSINYLKNNM